MFTEAELKVIAKAEKILRSKITNTPAFQNPEMVKVWMQTNIATLGHEVFAVLFLNTQYVLTNHEIMFRGTIDAASIYPREVVKAALMNNAAAVIFAHNHPSGNAAPSDADKAITRRLQAALDLIDVRVLDHLIVTVAGVRSFAEEGLI